MKLITLENLNKFWEGIKREIENIRDISGNAGTATKLATPRNINGTSFDGSASITTSKWGAARTVSITSYNGERDGSNNYVTVDGSSDITLKLPGKITADITGNSYTASKLEKSRRIKIGNMYQDFNGSSDLNFPLYIVGAATSDHKHSIEHHVVCCSYNSYNTYNTYNTYNSYSSYITFDSGTWYKIANIKMNDYSCTTIELDLNMYGNCLEGSGNWNFSGILRGVVNNISSKSVPTTLIYSQYVNGDLYDSSVMIKAIRVVSVNTYNTEIQIKFNSSCTLKKYSVYARVSEDATIEVPYFPQSNYSYSGISIGARLSLSDYNAHLDTHDI